VTRLRLLRNRQQEEAGTARHEKQERRRRLPDRAALDDQPLTLRTEELKPEQNCVSNASR